MALSLSLPLITIFFFLSILAGHAVRDLPKSNTISGINVSAGGFVLVATLFPFKDETWATNCFRQNKASLTYNEARTVATVRMQASGATSSSCSDFYIVQVGTLIISHYTIHAPFGDLALSFTYPGFEADIEKYGVKILLGRGTGYDRRMDKSVPHIVKDIEATLETF